MQEDIFYQIALVKTPRVGHGLAKKLIQQFKSAEYIFRASAKELEKLSWLPENARQGILSKQSFETAKAECLFIEKYNIQPLFYQDKAYPKRLRHIPDAPLLLYYKGTTPLNANRVVGIVGTRRPTPNGKLICERLVEQLVPYQPLVLSGLAYGIDITAHRKCVELGIPTIGIVAHGLDLIYPNEHLKTAQEMARNGGILSEFTSETPPLQKHFPMRNRILAGMIDVLIVVETAAKGGSMITAHLANDYHKDVFAIPGRLEDKYAAGCNHLIKTHKASLLESVEDIAYVMRWEKGGLKMPQRQLFVDLDPESQKIADTLQFQTASLHLEELIRKTGLSTSRLHVLLLELEFKGLLQALPGKHFRWIA